MEPWPSSASVIWNTISLGFGFGAPLSQETPQLWRNREEKEEEDEKPSLKAIPPGSSLAFSIHSRLLSLLSSCLFLALSLISMCLSIYLYMRIELRNDRFWFSFWALCLATVEMSENKRKSWLYSFRFQIEHTKKIRKSFYLKNHSFNFFDSVFMFLKLIICIS